SDKPGTLQVVVGLSDVCQHVRRTFRADAMVRHLWSEPRSAGQEDDNGLTGSGKVATLLEQLRASGQTGRLVARDGRVGRANRHGRLDRPISYGRGICVGVINRRTGVATEIPPP